MAPLVCAGRINGCARSNGASGASPLPHGICVEFGRCEQWRRWCALAGLTGVLGPTVGGGLPPVVVYQSQLFYLTHCHRGQAPSHLGSVLNLGDVNSGAVGVRWPD